LHRSSSAGIFNVGLPVLLLCDFRVCNCATLSYFYIGRLNSIKHASREDAKEYEDVDGAVRCQFLDWSL